MFFYRSVYLDDNLYQAGYPGLTHQDWKIECWEEERVNNHIRVAKSQFGNFVLHHCHRVAQVAFRVEMVSVLVSALSVGRVEVNPFLLTCSVSADSLWCHCRKEGIR